MAQQSNCNEILDLIPDYAFGLTDEATSRRIEAALPSCPEAVRQLAEYRRLQAAMRSHVPQVDPPASIAQRLRESTLADAAPPGSMTVRQTPPALSTSEQPVVLPVKRQHRNDPPPAAPPIPSRQRPTTATPPPAASRPPAAASRPAADEASAPAAPSGRPSDAPKVVEKPARRRFPLIAAAALIALVITNIYWLRRVDSLSEQVTRVNDTLAEYQNGAFAVRDESTLELARLEGDTNEWAMMMWDNSSSTGLMYTGNFPMLEVGKVYQLWLLNGDQPVSCGTFTVDEDGDGTIIFTAPQDISAFEAAGITEEPEGGSDQPTTTPLVLGSL